MAEQATRTDLATHLAEGRTYLWALRHSHERAQTPERQQEIRELFAELGGAARPSRHCASSSIQ